MNVHTQFKPHYIYIYIHIIYIYILYIYIFIIYIYTYIHIIYIHNIYIYIYIYILYIYYTYYIYNIHIIYIYIILYIYIYYIIYIYIRKTKKKKHMPTALQHIKIHDLKSRWESHDHFRPAACAPFVAPGWRAESDVGPALPAPTYRSSRRNPVRPGENISLTTQKWSNMKI